MQIQDQPHIGVLGADPAAITQFLRRVQALLGCVQPEKACSEQVLRSIIELELARGNDSVVLDSAQLCAAFAHFGLAARYPQAADSMELLAQAALLHTAAATGVRRA